jgi:hypothetical protein
LYQLDDKQKEEILDSFQRTVDKRNSKLISEDLYNHLNLNCNFPSHFSLQGFRDAYSDDGFQQFLEYFDQHSPQSQWLEAPEISRQYHDLNKSLFDYANSQSTSELVQLKLNIESSVGDSTPTETE